MATLDTASVGRRSDEVGQALLRRGRVVCDALLRKVIGSMREPFATMAGYHLGWWNANRSATDGSSGKGLRAARVLAAAAACDGDAGDAVMAAVAVELMHNFTLPHDDVMDGDATRRGRPTVWCLWGVTTAIVLGDALDAAAIRLVTDLCDQSVAVRAARRSEASCLDLCIGQFEDFSFEGRQGVTVDNCVRMAAGKTASLIGCACALGALSAIAAAATIAALERFGHELGRAFQFVDDLISICGDPTVTGKPVGSDLARRNATLPVVAALNSQFEAATGPVCVRKQIVHNSVVVAELRDRGAVSVDELDEIPDPAPPGAIVVFSDHGVSPALRASVEQRGLQVVDATCPLVAHVHAEAARFAARGDTVVLIAQGGHEETEGALGVAPASALLVETPADATALDLPADAQVSYLTQTTLALDDTVDVIDALRQRFPALGAPPSEEICYATTNRQAALRSIVDDYDLVLVIGSDNSSNSQRPVEFARRNGTPAYLIGGPEAIDAEWLSSVSTVGVTAGASAPPRLVQRVIDALAARGR